MDLSKYGYLISDSDGELRDISGIIAELKEVEANFSTHAMSDHALFLQGEKSALNKIIEYLERVAT